MALSKIKGTVIADNAINADRIADGTVVASDLLDNTLTGAKLATDIAINTTGTITATSFSGDGASLTALNVSTDSTPQLGGNLDLNSNDITGTGNINITGTVTADGLTFQSEGDTITFLTSSSVQGRLRTGDSFNTNSFQIEADNSVIINANMDDTNSSTNDAVFITTGSTFTATAKFDPSGDISFYEDTGTTPKMFWDASTERLGIGTSSPSAKLHIDLASAGTYFYGSSNNRRHLIISSGTGDSSIADALHDFDASSAYGVLSFSTTSTERMRINSSGNVGIGTTNPGGKLAVLGNSVFGGLASSFYGLPDSANFTGIVINGNLTTLKPLINLYHHYGADGDAGELKYFGISSGGNPGSIGYIRAVQSGTDISNFDGNLTFGTSINRVDSERMRITSSGRVGIGTSSPTATLNVETSNSAVAPNAEADDFFVESSGSTGITIGSGISSKSSLYFANSTDNDIASIVVSHAEGSMRFTNNASERMRINSSGNLLVGTTSNPSASGAVVSENGFFSSSINDMRARMIYEGARFTSTTGSEYIELNVGTNFAGSLNVFASNAGTGGNRNRMRSYMVTGNSTLTFNLDLVSQTDGLVDSLSPTFTITVPTSGVIRLTNTKSGQAALDYFIYFNGIG